MKILIVRLSSIGDVIHALPAVELLRLYFHDCSITWLVEERAADLLRGYQGIERLIVSNRTGWIKNLKNFQLAETIKDIRQFVRELRSVSYDIIIDFQGLLKSGLLVWIARGKRKVGYINAREASALFYNEKAPAVHFNDHAVKRHLGLISYIGLNDSPVIFHPLFSQENEVSVYSLFDKENICRDKQTVLFHPSSLWPTKLWAQNKMAKLSDLLQKNFGCQIVYIGSAEDNEYLNKICSSSNERIINLAGKTTLRELACLISKSALLVSVDSGPMHMACAVKTPVVALFGPTAPWRTGPFGENNTVIRKDIPCSPCFSRKNCPEGNHLCMEKIEVEDVYRACCNYLGRAFGL